MKKLLIILSVFFLSDVRAQMLEDTELTRKMGSKTAKQTWWFFDKRLKDTIDYSYHHVYIASKDIYIRDIKQLPSGKYNGIIDLELPHSHQFNESNQEIDFDSIEVDDWFMVKDKILVGGFQLRLSHDLVSAFKKIGHFTLAHSVINHDFIESSSYTSRDFTPPFYTLDSLGFSLFKGGKEALLNYMINHLNYSKYARAIGIQGSVTLGFEIDTSGYISHIKVLRGVGGGLNDIARDLLFELRDQWNPYYKDGRAVPVQLVLPIVFRLN